jgi:hypothetical protein
VTATPPTSPVEQARRDRGSHAETESAASQLPRFLISWLQRVLFGLVIVGGMYVSVHLSIAIRLSHHGISRFLWIGGLTPLIFGYILSDSRAWWKRPPFWAMTALFVAAHLLAFGEPVPSARSSRPVA